MVASLFCMSANISCFSVHPAMSRPGAARAAERRRALAWAVTGITERPFSFAQNVGVRFRRQPWSSFCYALLPCRDTPPLLPRN